ncbi:MAG TPA: hypothetical protein VIE65_09735 [Methylobacter sp.]|jgi:dTDP-4-dehydrorhamnose 3,5-epimerase-like enzyme
MIHDEYVHSVMDGEWPIDPTVPLDAPFTNQNGRIQNLILQSVTSVAHIASVAGAVRANHYHKTDWHFTYVVRGCVAYLERDIGSKLIPEPRIYKAGMMFFTPPLREHCMVFIEDTDIITLAKNVRSHESHESDVVRVDFISNKTLEDQIQAIARSKI